MATTALQAGKRICEAGEWKFSNLSVQKILYIAHMFHLAQDRGPLIQEHFEAWDYGPVVPELYHKAKTFGSGPVKNVFHSIPDMEPGEEADILVDAVEGLGSARPGKLIAITHWKKGAWAEYYTPGLRGIIIPNEAIKAEYERRLVEKKK